MTSQSQVNTDVLLVFHFILQSLEATGSPPCLLYQFMQSFICPSEIIYEEIVFNWRPIDKVIRHGHAVNDMVKDFFPMRLRVWSYSSPTIVMRTGETFFVRPGSMHYCTEVSESGHSEGHLDHTPTVQGALLPDALATFLHGKE